MGKVKSRLAACACVILLVAVGCGGSSQTYSMDDVQEAFASQGFTGFYEVGSFYALPTGGDGGYPPPWIGTDLPATRDELPTSAFTVVVASDSEADDAWPAYLAQQDAGSFDARRANVVVVSGGVSGPVVFADGLNAEQREELRERLREGRARLAEQRDRISAALAALPDRGFPVVVGS